MGHIRTDIDSRSDAPAGGAFAHCEGILADGDVEVFQIAQERRAVRKAMWYTLNPLTQWEQSIFSNVPTIKGFHLGFGRHTESKGSLPIPFRWFVRWGWRFHQLYRAAVWLACESLTTYDVIIVLLIAGLTFWCVSAGVTSELNPTLITSAIGVPLAFNVQAAFQRRERALQELARLKSRSSNVITGTMVVRNEFLTTEQASYACHSVVRIFDHLRRYVESPYEPHKAFALQGLCVCVHDMCLAFDTMRVNAYPPALIQRLERDLTELTEAFENLRVIADYRSPAIMRAYSRVWVALSSLFLAPYISGRFLGAGGVARYFAIGLAIFVPVTLSALRVLQMRLELPFGGHEDDVNLIYNHHQLLYDLILPLSVGAADACASSDDGTEPPSDAVVPHGSDGWYCALDPLQPHAPSPPPPSYLSAATGGPTGTSPTAALSPSSSVVDGRVPRPPPPAADGAAGSPPRPPLPPSGGRGSPVYSRGPTPMSALREAARPAPTGAAGRSPAFRVVSYDALPATTAAAGTRASQRGRGGAGAAGPASGATTPIGALPFMASGIFVHAGIGAATGPGGRGGEGEIDPVTSPLRLAMTAAPGRDGRASRGYRGGPPDRVTSAVSASSWSDDPLRSASAPSDSLPAQHRLSPWLAAAQRWPRSSADVVVPPVAAAAGRGE